MKTVGKKSTKTKQDGPLGQPLPQPCQDDSKWSRLDLVAEESKDKAEFLTPGHNGNWWTASQDKRACGFKHAAEGHDDEDSFHA